MTFEIKGQNFYKNSKKVFMNSGEIHYFRIRRSLWETHLKGVLEAGLDTVSTYVPWAWHEDVEGVFDFDGSTHPQRDLLGWIKLCKAMGLQLILKPGPFILAEFRGAGLPDWFLENHGLAVKMHNSKGEIVPSDGVSLFHPVYLEKVGRWYDQIMPLIAEYQQINDGPVIMMQVCNEIGVFSWLAHQADYSSPVKPMWISYLKNKYNQIEDLNSSWGTQLNDFSEVPLPPDGNLPYASSYDRSRDFDWHFFWRKYYADYLLLLVGMIRERGVQLPVYHNLPGWIYGSGYEFPVNITMYDELYGNKSEIIFGVDHIPEFVSYRNMHDDRIINDITAAMQGEKPLFAAEFQSGSREYHVVTNPREMEVFYKASIANGLKGWNYYMFSQGKNEPRKGYSGDTFYWFNPMDAQGNKTSAFPLIQRMSKIIRTNESVLLEAERKAEICVLFYPPYYASELERPETGNASLDFVAARIRRQAYYDGLLRVLQVLNVEYDMADLTKVDANTLKPYKQLWAFSTNEMDEQSQKILADYTLNGGQLVIYPAFPDRNLSQQTCTYLRDRIGLAPLNKESVDSPLIDLLGLSDIKCANPQLTYDEDSLDPDEVIARTLSGNACGFVRVAGNGSVVHLGTWLGFDTEGHKPAYLALLQLSGANIWNATASSEYITVRQRFADNRSLLFVANYHNEAHMGPIYYKHPKSHEIVSIPLIDKDIEWPALSACLIPVGLDLASGIQLLHSTSDILSYEGHEKSLMIELYGHPDLTGELVLEGDKVGSLSHVVADGVECKMTKLDGRVVINYYHLKNKSFTLQLLLES